MKKRDRQNIRTALVLLLQISISMLVPIFFCTWVGYLIGDRTGHPIISVAGFFVGAVSGFNGVYKLVQGFLKDDKKTKDTK